MGGHKSVKVINIGVVGDYDATFPPQVTIRKALQHTATLLEVSVEVVWIPTKSLLETQGTKFFQQFDGIWGGPGDVQALDGVLRGIQFAREHLIPYLGTCAGFQYAVLEFARNVLGISDATSAEFNPTAPRLILSALTCNIAGQQMLVKIQPNSLAYRLYGQAEANEEYFCHFGINPAYREAIEQAGLQITGADQAGEPRIFELPTHPFFVASLFVPQTTSTPESPHPLITGFVKSCQAAQSSSLLRR